MSENKVVGLTKDAGFQLGVRKTVHVTHEEAWAYIFSMEGMEVWLGEVPGGSLVRGSEQTLSDGTWIEIRTFKQLSHVRMKWRPEAWENTSRLQLRVYPRGRAKTVIAFHQEMLQDETQRMQMKAHWKSVVDRLIELLEG
ncbi:MAG: SRPBCC domain-containing protein [Bacteroidota bacterium]